MATRKPADAPQDASALPEGQTVTPEQYEADQAAYEAQQVAGPDLTVCVNDGKSAAYRTSNPGQVPVAFCEDCARRTYPTLQGLDPVSAPAE